MLLSYHPPDGPFCDIPINGEFPGSCYDRNDEPELYCEKYQDYDFCKVIPGTEAYFEAGGEEPIDCETSPGSEYCNGNHGRNGKPFCDLQSEDDIRDCSDRNKD